VAETPTAQTASLEGIEAELLGAIAKAADLGALEEVRVTALGKKGRVSELMQTLGRMAPEERKSFGQAVNQLKERVGEALERKRETLGRGALSARLAAERADVTLPVREGPLAEGRIHPVSQVADEISRRLISTFLDDGDGHRPAFGAAEKLQTDPTLHDRLLFNEYFHGDTGAGLGATHQTGWTGLVAALIVRNAERARGAEAP